MFLKKEVTAIQYLNKDLSLSVNKDLLVIRSFLWGQVFHGFLDSSLRNTFKGYLFGYSKLVLLSGKQGPLKGSRDCNQRAFCESTSHISHIPHPAHPTSRTSHILHIPHPEHPTTWNSHIPNIPHLEHPTYPTSNILNIPDPVHPTFHILNMPFPSHITFRTCHILSDRSYNMNRPE